MVKRLLAVGAAAVTVTLLAVSSGAALPESTGARSGTQARTTMYVDYLPIGWIEPSSSSARRWYIYADYQRVGYLRQSYSSKWNIYIGSRNVGYMRPSYSGRWSVYVSYVPVGHVRQSYGSRWNAYHNYLPIGYARGLGGHLAACVIVALYDLGYVG